jgi:hypothetical protein
VTKPEEKSDFTPVKAKAHTAKLQKSSEGLYELIKDASYLGRIWLALGHKTWDAYLDAELGGIPLTLPRENRKATVVSLAQAGMSTRAIAAATGVSKSTIAGDIAQSSTFQNRTFEPEPGDDSTPPELDGDNITDAQEVDEDGNPLPDGCVLDDDGNAVPAGRAVKGLDGKERTVAARPKEPEPEPIPAVIRKRRRSLLAWRNSPSAFAVCPTAMTTRSTG